MGGSGEAESENDRLTEIVIVGGGLAGCAADVFTAREGLDAVTFDRGRSSLKRCAHLENHPGFHSIEKTERHKA